MKTGLSSRMLLGLTALVLAFCWPYGATTTMAQDPPPNGGSPPPDNTGTATDSGTAAHGDGGTPTDAAGDGQGQLDEGGLSDGAEGSVAGDEQGDGTGDGRLDGASDNVRRAPGERSAAGHRGRTIEAERQGVSDARKEIGPQKRQELSGRLVYVDSGERMIELEGPVLEITRKTRILNRQGKEFPVESFVKAALETIDAGGELPLVAVDVQPSRGAHPVATRIRVIGSFSDHARRDNLVVGPLVLR